MRILVVSPFPPHPARGGGRMRLWHLVRHLGRRHGVTVACVQRAAQEGPSASDDLRRLCDDVVVVELDPSPDLADPRLPREVQRYRSVAMADELCRLRDRRFDVAVFEHIFMAQYRVLFPDVPAVIDEHNIESEVMAQLARLAADGNRLRDSGTLATQTFADAGHEAERLRAYEDTMWPTFDLRVTVSESDRAELVRRCPAGPTITVPNGADVDPTPLLPLEDGARLLFMGTLDYYPNVDALHWFLEEVFPRLDGVELCIAGRNPSPAIRALAGLPGVDVVAYPRSMDALAARSRVVVLPLRFGGGTRLRIPHAFALGVPVVSTSLGCTGYDVAHGHEILIADDAAAFAHAVRCLLDDDDLAQRLRRSARRLVEERYRWDTVLAPLDASLSLVAGVGP